MNIKTAGNKEFAIVRVNIHIIARDSVVIKNFLSFNCFILSPTIIISLYSFFSNKKVVYSTTFNFPFSTCATGITEQFVVFDSLYTFENISSTFFKANCSVELYSVFNQ